VVKNEGDKVKTRQVIAEIETDKATMKSKRLMKGVIGKILVAAGTEGVAVNAPIAILLEEGESVRTSFRRKPESLHQRRWKAALTWLLRHVVPTPASAGVTAISEKDYTGPTKTMTVREALRDCDG